MIEVSESDEITTTSGAIWRQKRNSLRSKSNQLMTRAMLLDFLYLAVLIIRYWTSLIVTNSTACMLCCKDEPWLESDVITSKTQPYAIRLRANWNQRGLDPKPGNGAYFDTTKIKGTLSGFLNSISIDDQKISCCDQATWRSGNFILHKPCLSIKAIGIIRAPPPDMCAHVIQRQFSILTKSLISLFGVGKGRGHITIASHNNLVR